MKLTSNFIEILKNFSTINPGILFKKGNKLRTINSSKSIMAEAEVEDVIDREFGIYDLSRFLALLSINKGSPEIELEEDSVVFIGLGGKGRIRQRYTSKNLITSPADKNIPMKNCNVEFELKEDVLKWIFSVSSVLKCPQTVIQGNPGEAITVHAVDVKGDIVDSAFVTIDTKSLIKFKAVINNENIKVIPDNYNVKLSDAGFVLFTQPNRKLQYWISIEAKTSSFD